VVARTPRASASASALHGPPVTSGSSGAATVAGRPITSTVPVSVRGPGSMANSIATPPPASTMRAGDTRASAWPCARSVAVSESASSERVSSSTGSAVSRRSQPPSCTPMRAVNWSAGTGRSPSSRTSSILVFPVRRAASLTTRSLLLAQLHRHAGEKPALALQVKPGPAHVSVERHLLERLLARKEQQRLPRQRLVRLDPVGLEPVARPERGAQEQADAVTARYHFRGLDLRLPVPLPAQVLGEPASSADHRAAAEALALLEAAHVPELGAVDLDSLDDHVAQQARRAEPPVHPNRHLALGEEEIELGLEHGVRVTVLIAQGRLGQHQTLLEVSQAERGAERHLERVADDPLRFVGKSDDVEPAQAQRHLDAHRERDAALAPVGHDDDVLDLASRQQRLHAAADVGP
jgi:hypothetical protein